MQLPTACIIIANKNYSMYLQGAVESALNQNYPADKLTVYIYDDASTDNSWELLQEKYFSKVKTEVFNFEYQSKVCDWANGVHIIATKSPKSEGPSKARNVAITSTLKSTDIYAVLDADDVYYPDKLLKCVQPIMMDSRMGVVYTDYDILNVETGNVIREYKQPYDKLVLQNECIVHSGAIISKTALEAVYEKTGFYDENLFLCEDYDLWLRISDKFMISHIPESLSLVRVHKKNSTFTNSNEAWQNSWRIVREKMISRNA